MKGLCVRGELETEQTATYWPQVPLNIAALLSHSARLLNRGLWGSKPSAGSWFSLPRTATRTPTNWLRLWHWVISLFDIHLLPVGVTIAPNSTRPRSRLYLDIFDRMHLFLDWRLGRRSIFYICTTTARMDLTLNNQEGWHAIKPRNQTLTLSKRSAGAAEYADCISAEGEESSPNVCPWYDTKLHFMVRLKSWSFEEAPYFHYSQVHADSEW